MANNRICIFADSRTKSFDIDYFACCRHLKRLQVKFLSGLLT
uniref:Uncharacterized protein n=1 Tax=Human betaherpesvirus 6 TaxID=10368 RepID=A0A5P9U3Y6_9BETA|nr:hypothetical protein [Human betaherpesvirus 6]